LDGETTHIQNFETMGTEASPDDATALSAHGLSPGEAGGFDREIEDAGFDEQDAEAGDAGADDRPGVPDSYALTAPEGMSLDPEAVAAATPVLRELGLSNEQANKLVPVAGQFAQGIMDKSNRAILAQVQADRKAWLDSARADPEIGGRHWDATLDTASRALDALGFARGSPFRVLLDESGLGNHPEMIRAFKKVGEAIGEDGFERGNGASASRRPIEERWYGNSQGGE
jgi:hypothetical protein